MGENSNAVRPEARHTMTRAPRAARVEPTMTEPKRNACGPHQELASNEAVRVTRCPCGTVHLAIAGNGVTLRLKDDALPTLTRGLMQALDKVEAIERVVIN